MTDFKEDYEALFRLKPIPKDERVKQVRWLKPKVIEKLKALKKAKKGGNNEAVFHDKKR